MKHTGCRMGCGTRFWLRSWRRLRLPELIRIRAEVMMNNRLAKSASGGMNARALQGRENVRGNEEG